jgi:ribosome biogenesis protein MAK21
VRHAHARYYGTIRFNRMAISTSADRSSARTLMDFYFQLFPEVVCQREPESTDDVVPTVEEPKDKQIEKTREKKARGHHGESKQVRGAAGFADLQDSNAKLLGAILTGINRALPYARLGGENAE